VSDDVESADRMEALEHEFKMLRQEVEHLMNAHQQHRSSDNAFLRSLGMLTETVQVMQAKLVVMQEAHATLCNKVTAAVLMAEQMSNDIEEQNSGA